MELAKGKDLQICPIKRLYLELENRVPDRKTIAILCSAKEICEDKLGALDDYIIIRAVDTSNTMFPMAFSLEKGELIKEFLDRNCDFEQVYVCCDSGESRSTAISAAMMCYYGKSDTPIWKDSHYHPNLLVYKEQCLAFGKRISKLKIKYLKFINDKALQNVIKLNRKRR